jgi:hypothetical protein
MPHKINWKDVGDDVRKNVESGIGEVECINIDTVTSSDCCIPDFSNRITLKKAG